MGLFFYSMPVRVLSLLFQVVPSLVGDNCLAFASYMMQKCPGKKNKVRRKKGRESRAYQSMFDCSFF